MELELLVVDNGSGDGSVEYLERRGVPHLALPENIGFAAAVNLGARRTAALAVLALNADTVLEPGCAGALLAALGVGIYDTQCGAKAFRATPQLAGALADPFAERWAFDVELLSRLTRSPEAVPWTSIIEVPLLKWHAKGGSKLRSGQAARAAVELLRIGRRHLRAT